MKAVHEAFGIELGDGLIQTHRDMLESGYSAHEVSNALVQSMTDLLGSQIHAYAKWKGTTSVKVTLTIIEEIEAYNYV